jgi:hypothetical protein
LIGRQKPILHGARQRKLFRKILFLQFFVFQFPDPRQIDACLLFLAIWASRNRIN